MIDQLGGREREGFRKCDETINSLPLLDSFDPNCRGVDIARVMPSSSTGIQRTSSPQPQSARSRTSQSSTSHSHRNYLQQPDYTYSNHTPDLTTGELFLFP